jgi:hypothetical protein
MLTCVNGENNTVISCSSKFDLGHRNLDFWVHLFLLNFLVCFGCVLDFEITVF